MQACLSTGPGAEVETATKGVITEAATEADAVVKEAKTKVDNIENLYDKAQKDVTKWETEVEGYLSKLRKKSEDMEESKRILHEECVSKCPEGRRTGLIIKGNLQELQSVPKSIQV